MSLSKRLIGVLGALTGMIGLMLAVPHFVRAQTPPASEELQRRYDAAFQEMLRKPADLDVLFKFAALASQTGDLEGAISALERMLLINGDLPRVRLELGVLYLRLNSFEVARTYFEEALKSPNLPPDVRTKAQEYLNQAQARTKKSRLSGELFLGWRYQSNANLGPATSSVQLFGQAANLNQSSLGQSDWGAVTSAQFRHTYDFGHQDNAALESQLTLYANRQFNVSAANVSLIDLTTGPRFQIFNGKYEDVTVKPFVTAGYIWINDAPYYGSVGGGVETNILLADGLRSISSALWRRHDNEDNWYLPTNSLFRGTEYTANTALHYDLTSIILVTATGSAQRYESDLTPAQSYQLWSVGGSFAFRFDDPVLKTGLQWSIALSVTEQWWHYDQPDALVDPTIQRYQTDTIANITFLVPFDDRTTFTLSGGRFVRNATVSNYAFENNSVMFGVSWRF
ncbi:MAG TPA: hypothetical protein VMI56_19005 [Reyranella sp.]|nr:hypothetical protein [Reyranella sp.]